MSVCPDCKIRVFEVDDGLFKCSSCGVYWRDNDGVLVPYSLKMYPYSEALARSFAIIGLGRPRVEVGDEVTVPVDPEFEEFLKAASQYGAPGSVKAFNELSAADKQYYLRAYPIYVREKKKLEEG